LVASNEWSLCRRVLESCTSRDWNPWEYVCVDCCQIIWWYQECVTFHLPWKTKIRY
jgi:hypothetical protein